MPNLYLLWSDKINNQIKTPVDHVKEIRYALYTGYAQHAEALIVSGEFKALANENIMIEFDFESSDDVHMLITAHNLMKASAIRFSLIPKHIEHAEDCVKAYFQIRHPIQEEIS